MTTAASAQHHTTRILPESEAAAYIGIATGTLRNWRSRRQGPAFLRVGRRRLYAVADLDLYLAGCREDPEAAR